MIAPGPASNGKARGTTPDSPGTLHTLKNFKDKLHDANPTVLWSGGGYHLLQPLHANVILEMESIFAKFHEPPIIYRLVIAWSEYPGPITRKISNLMITVKM